MQQAGSSGRGLSSVSAPDSGLVTYYIDGYENYQISEKIKASDFDKAGYDKKAMKSGDYAEGRFHYREDHPHRTEESSLRRSHRSACRMDPGSHM